MINEAAYIAHCKAWLVEQIEQMTDEMLRMSPSEFAEANRWLPPSVTPFPGYMDFDLNPFMREIVDCFDIHSPVREVNLRKGVQITYTTALECVILYYMAQIKTAPMMFVTADKELAKQRVENNITPMINWSGFDHLIQSSDEKSSRKTGQTEQHIQWVGGGYLQPFGANNANKMRQASIMVMLKDELDGWPERVGKDGDPDRLTDDRCSGYWERRKIMRGSTPLLRGMSKIDSNFYRGDQRYYMVPCLSCGYFQEIKWRGVDEQTGRVYGMTWETENGVLVQDSVRWVCANCGHGHAEHDKVKLLDPANGAHWKPTAEPAEPGIRSYHLPALYSPVGMQPWAKSVAAWMEAYDDENSQARDIEKLQRFYNNVLALSFELRGDTIKMQNVSGHRRTEYGFGSVPNQYAIQYTGSPIELLICTVDVHKRNLAVAVHGFARGERTFLVDYWRFEGDCEDLDSPDTWGRLREVIETRVYETTDGRVYPIAMTLIDASWSNDLVTEFCSEYETGVFPILGRDTPAKNQSIKEFAEFTTQQGTRGFRVTVDLYKDRWAARLNKRWSGEGVQPEGTYNAPVDVTDAQLKELTVEVKREKIDEKTNKRVGVVWHRPGHANNELWDLLIYATAGLEMLAWDVCRNQMGLEAVNWPGFWDMLESEQLFFDEVAQ